MALTDSEISTLKVPYGRNQFKVSDGGGLYLLVKSSGRYWKLAYRFDGKQKSLALGVYPQVTIEEARGKRDAAKSLLAQGVDPGEIKKKQRDEERQARVEGGLEHKSKLPAQSVNHRPVVATQAEQDRIESRRLLILNILSEVNRYTANEEFLLQELASRGALISFDRLRTDLAWLYEQGAVDIKRGALWGVYLSQSGFDAVYGRTWIPGIRQPESIDQ